MVEKAHFCVTLELSVIINIQQSLNEKKFIKELLFYRQLNALLRPA